MKKRYKCACDDCDFLLTVEKKKDGYMLTVSSVYYEGHLSGRVEAGRLREMLDAGWVWVRIGGAVDGVELSPEDATALRKFMDGAR